MPLQHPLTRTYLLSRRARYRHRDRVWGNEGEVLSRRDGYVYEATFTDGGLVDLPNDQGMLRRSLICFLLCSSGSRPS